MIVYLQVVSVLLSLCYIASGIDGTETQTQHRFDSNRAIKEIKVIA